MTIYLFVFALSLFFAQWGNRKRPTEESRKYFILFALMLPVLLAAMRSSTIGTDTSNYLGMFHDASAANMSFSFLASSHPDVEKGYLLFVFLCGQLFNNDMWFLFATHCIIILPLFYAAYKFSDRISLTLSLFIFLALFFNESLNLMRQYMAMSLIVLSQTFIIQNKKIKGVLFLMAAISIHYTAVIAMLIMGIYYLTKHFPIRKHILIYSLIVVFLIYSLVNIAAYLDVIFPSGSDFSEKYAEYLSGKSNSISSLSTAIVYAVILGVLFYKRTNWNSSLLDFFFMLAIMAFLFNFLSMYSKTLYRMSLYFSIFTCISIPLVLYGRKGIKKEYVTLPLFVALLAFYWFFSVVIHGSNDTYPYVSNVWNY